MAPGFSPGGAAGKGEAATPAGAADGSPDPGLLAELHRRLSVAARRCYPAAARAFRLRGSSPVRFCLDGKGNAGAVSLLGTTGSPLLDRAAEDCVIPGALPLPGTGCYTVRIDFTGP
jgi:outer membrane biosynthesis protein TonB